MDSFGPETISLHGFKIVALGRLARHFLQAGNLRAIAISCLSAAAATAMVTATGHAQAYGINDMGRECTAKIGKIAPFSCLDGQLIPVTVNDRPLPPGQFTSVCDRPSFLAPAFCNPYARVGRLPNVDKDGRPDNDVENIFICRRYNQVTDPNNPDFKDVAIIQHRKSTGATCFFQHLDPYINATRVPPPAEPANQTPPGKPTAEQFWLSPAGSASIGCNRCHDAGPFIHSPYLTQVTAENEPIVYPFPDDGGNYRFVGEPFQSWGTPQMINPLGNRCTNCHVFGTQSSSSTFARYSAGRARPTQITDLYAKYPDSHWMPPDQSREMPEDQWNRLYGAAVDQILGCNAQNNMAPGGADCGVKPFGPP